MFRVLHIIPSLNKGGAERITLDICKYLSVRNDVEVLLVLMSNDISYPVPTGVNYVVTNSFVELSVWKKTKCSLDHLNQLIDSFKPNVIHSHLFVAEVLSRARIRKKIMYVTHVHDNIVQFEHIQFHKNLKRRLLNFYEKKWIMHRYRKVRNQFISISKDTTRFLQTNLGKRFENNVFELPNAIDYDRFYFAGQKKMNETIHLISVGSLVEKKNQRMLIYIAEILRDKKVNFKISILGDGVKRNFLEKEILNRGFVNSVHLLGNVDDVPSYLNQASIFVHTAIYEPFGLVLLEAMAAGLPVVSLDGGGNRDIVIDGKNGFLIAENEPSLFADKIIELANNEDLYQNMSSFSKEFSKAFDIKMYVEQLMRFYETKIRDKNYSLKKERHCS